MKRVSNEPVIVRADASTQIGIGHVMRCLALGQAWRDTRGEAIFAMAMGSPAIESRLTSEDIDIFPVSARVGSAEDAMQTADLAQQKGASWVAVDGYLFDPAYQRIIKDSGLNLLLIDDNGHAAHYYADVVLNQNIDANKGMYMKRESYTHLLLGTRYVLLRREFLTWRGWKRQTPRVARNVLVTMGGSDPDNVTSVVMQALPHIGVPGMQAVVLAGPGNPHYGELKTAIADLSPPIRLEFEGVNMPELMKWADVAITAGGITCWELAFMQVPALIVVTADNQWSAAHGLDSKGVFRLLGQDVDVSERELVTELGGLMRNAPLRVKMSAKGCRLVDGRGAERLLQMMT